MDTKTKREVMDMVASLGATVVDFQDRKRHKTLWVAYKGQRFPYVLASTASDHRALLNARANIKRRIKEIDNGIILDRRQG